MDPVEPVKSPGSNYPGQFVTDRETPGSHLVTSFHVTYQRPLPIAVSPPGSSGIPGYPGIPGLTSNPDPGIFENKIPGFFGIFI